MFYLFQEDRRTTYEGAERVVRWSKQLRIQKLTLVEDSALRNTVTVCSWAEMSSMVRGRLAVGCGQISRRAGKRTHYFSTQGCSAGMVGWVDSAALLLCWG